MRFLNGLATIPVTHWLNDIGLFTLGGFSVIPIIGLAVSVLSARLRDKQIRQAIAQSEQLFAVFMDNLPGYAWMKDRAGRYLYVNHGVKSLAPYQNGWLSKTDAEIWPGEIGGRFWENDLRVIATGEKLETIESFTVIGEQRYVLVTKFPIFDDQGTVTMVGGMSVDITEHKQAEWQLRQAEERYRSIFENAVEGIFQTTPDGRFIGANPALARMYGFDSPEELINTRTDIARDVFVDPKSREEFKQSLEEEGFIVDFELEAYRKDGSKIWISENVRAVRDQAGKVVYYEGTTQDITARKLAEQALRKSEERYRELFENAKDGIYVHDLSGRYKSVNRAIEKLSGYSREEILGKDSSSFVAPEYLGHVQENFCKKLRQESETSYEVEIITKDGRHVPVEVNSNLIYENGSPAGVQAVVRDITERRAAEEAIRQAEQKFRGIFENAGEGVFQSTPDGRFLAANPELARMHGFDSPEELIRNYNNISDQVYVDGTRREEFKRLLEEQGAVRGLEHQVFRKDGSKIWIAVNARVVRDHNRQILYYEGTAQDITERKRVERALTESERRKAAILKSALDCVVTIDYEGNIIDFNPAAEQTFGYTSEDIIGKSLVDLIIPPSYRPNHSLGFDRYLATGCSSMLGKRIEVSALRSDGTEFPVELTVTAIGELPRPTFTAFIRDLTERRRAEAALKNYSRLLIEAQEAERQKIARELHDQIGQLLTAIRINLQTVRDCSETTRSQALTDEGMTLVDNALGQVRDLSFELRPSLLDDLGLIAALRWYADHYTQRTGVKACRVIELAGQRLPRDLETACFRIVQEALTNVARHAGAKEVVINLQRLTNAIFLSIKDDGCGFDTSAINSRSFPIRLGLRGMEERVLALGGRLAIESGPAKGTEVLAIFPDQESDENQAYAKSIDHL